MRKGTWEGGEGDVVSLIDGYAEASPLRARASQITRPVVPHGTKAQRTVAYDYDAADRHPI
ncbi:MAG: hypothetical protein ACK55Z_08875, partial [bacterium]